jgi:hypothetical protein
MREVGNLPVGEGCLMRGRRRPHRWSDVATEPIAKHGNGPNQVGPVRPALGRAAVAVDALRGVDTASAQRRGGVYLLSVGGATLRGDRNPEH